MAKPRPGVGDLVQLLWEVPGSYLTRSGVQLGIVIDIAPHRWPSLLEDEKALQIITTESWQVEEWSELDVKLISRI